MIDKDTLTSLQEGSATTMLTEAVTGAMDSGLAYVFAPATFQAHDLEKLLPTRRRARALMTTSSVDDFATYCAANKEAGAAVFIDPDSMTARAVLNLGTPTMPGHADNLADLQARKAAAFTALLATANGGARTQTAVAEFLEDWAPAIICTADGVEVPFNKAVDAVRKITIEGMRKVESSEKQLSASRGVLESVTASSTETLPTHIEFRCEPYQGFQPRTFILRLGVITTDKPAITLRIANHEKHIEEMAQELASLVRTAIGGGLPVLVGKYAAKV